MTATTRTARTRRLLVPVATLLAAASIAVASGATFSSSSANAASAVTSGTLTHSNSRANQAIFSATNIKPGDTVVGKVTITNTGTLPAKFSLHQAAANNGFVDKGMLGLKVVDESSNTERFAGTFGANFGNNGTVDLGTWNPGEARTFRFEAKLDQNATNQEQNKTATATFSWSGVQTDGVVIGG